MFWHFDFKFLYKNKSSNERIYAGDHVEEDLLIVDMDGCFEVNCVLVQMLFCHHLLAFWWGHLQLSSNWIRGPGHDIQCPTIFSSLGSNTHQLVKYLLGKK